MMKRASTTALSLMLIVAFATVLVGHLRPTDHVYTVADVQVGLHRDPHAWIGRIVLIRGRCRIPRDVRPVPLHLRPCSADRAPIPQNHLITRRLWTQDVGIGARSMGLSAGSGHLARNKGAFRVE